MSSGAGHDHPTAAGTAAVGDPGREPGRGRRRGLGRGGARLRVDWVGECLAVSFGAVDAATAALAYTMPSEPDRIALVMPHADSELMPYLARQLAHWIPLQWDSMRLVAGYAAAPSEKGVPAAQELSDLLGIEVLAPDGQLLAVPGGSLFVHAVPVTGRSGWWRFRPGRPPAVSGRRFPSPEWEFELAAFVEAGMAGVDAEEIPAGLWMHRPGPRHPTDLAFALPVNQRSVTLVVSRAGDQPLPAADVQRLIGAMPEALRKRLVVTPYGDEPVAEVRLGEVASVAANRTLRVRTGLPLYCEGLGSQVYAIGSDGLPTWRPFAREMAWRPHAGSRIHRWDPPDDHLLPAARGQLRLTDRWTVEVIEAGLWIREVDRLDGSAAVRQLPLESTYCNVVVSVADDSPVQPPWRAIARMLRRLPTEAQDRLRMAVPEEAGTSIVRAAARACGRVAGVRRVCLLTDDGRLVQWQKRPRRDRPPWYWDSPEFAAYPPDADEQAAAEAAAKKAQRGGPPRGDQRPRPPGRPPVVAVPDLVVSKGGSLPAPAPRAKNGDSTPPGGGPGQPDARRDDKGDKNGKGSGNGKDSKNDSDDKNDKNDKNDKDSKEDKGKDDKDNKE